MKTLLGQYGRKSSVVNVAVLAIAVAPLLLAGALVTQQPASAAGGKPVADPRRGFYLTPFDYTGSQALNACAAGFHMASIWELLDPSNLRYETALGFTNADSGFGPPMGFQTEGWVRTGGTSHDTAFPQNCEAWTQDGAGATTSGTRVSLGSPLDGQSFTAPATRISPWVASTAACNGSGGPTKVWCAQD